MALDVNALKEQIAKEKQSLKSVDENIKKITGRDPNEPRERLSNDTRRISLGSSARGRDLSISFRRHRSDSQNAEKDSEPPRKRAAVFSRLGASTAGRRVAVSRPKEEKEEDDYDEEDVGAKPAVQSSIVSTAKKITRDELINAQNAGEKGKARNRRMFGMLLGTLAKFNSDGQGRQSKQTLKQREVESRLEEETEQERKKLASERKTLFTERRLQQRRINLMEEKIALANELNEWEEEWEKKSQFIMTKASPSIFFLPTEFTPRTQRALQDSKERIKGLVEKHKASVADTMNAYDDEIKILENKQDIDNGNGVKIGEGVHVTRRFKKGGKIDNEPEEEMDLDSMEHHVDIKVDVEDGEQNTVQTEVERNSQSPPIETEDGDTEDVLDAVPGGASSDKLPKVAVENSNHEVDVTSISDPVPENDDQNKEVQSPLSEDTAAKQELVNMGENENKSSRAPCDVREKEVLEDDEKGVNSSHDKAKGGSSDNSSGSEGKECETDNKEAELGNNIPLSLKNSDDKDESKETESKEKEHSVKEKRNTVADPVTSEDEPEVTKSSSRRSAGSSKKQESRKRRQSSSSSDSSSSSSSDEKSKKSTRRPNTDNRMRKKGSRDSYRSRRRRRDRSRSGSRDRYSNRRDRHRR